jgi:hypothetical protein
MRLISNAHQREYPVSPDRLGALFNTLASTHDLLWPQDWPPLRFDRPIAVGARGGHGPIRYSVIDYQPGRRVVFTFDPGLGLAGTHELEIRPGPAEGTSTMRHTAVVRATGVMWLRWPLALRWLHDALVEALLHRAAVQVGRRPNPIRYSPWVRLLRFVIERKAAQSAASGVSALRSASSQLAWRGTDPGASAAASPSRSRR